MIICSNYKKCRRRKCDHKVPHLGHLWTCMKQPCSYKLPEKFFCEEELYVYMKEAIKETSNIDNDTPL